MIIPYEPEHLLSLDEQTWQRGFKDGRQTAEALKQGYCSYTAICNTTHKPLICAGVVEIWTQRAMCWASFDKAARPVMPEAHKRALLELDRLPFRRLEMYVLPGFLQAWRWAQLLGFEFESIMARGSPDGRDLLVFVRIRQGRTMRRFKRHAVHTVHAWGT